jgi:cytidylate kinase
MKTEPTKATMQSDPSISSFANEIQLEQCNSYILRQLQIRKKPTVIHAPPPPGPAITISHQTGSGEHQIATRLAAILKPAQAKGAAPWTVFDRHLVEKVLEEHHLPQSLAKFMPEDRRSYLKDTMDELLGVRPPSWMVLPQIAETVLHLADAGSVILVGRGASFITARMPNVFHVRLIASLSTRIERVQKLNNLMPKEAARFVAGSDRGRGRYVKAHFHVSVDDDLQYHLVLNTDRIPPPEAAELIAEGARRCFKGGPSSKK